MNTPKSRQQIIRLIFVIFLLIGCSAPGAQPTPTPPLIPPPTLATVPTFAPPPASTLPPTSPPAYTSALPPTSPTPIGSTGGSLFKLVNETKVTPVGSFAGGAFVRCDYVPGRDRMVVAFKAQLSQEEAGCTNRWAQAYREYTKEMQETGDYRIITCMTGPDVGGLLLGDEYYFAAMGYDNTKKAEGWWLAKYDAVTWKPLVEPFFHPLEPEEKTADPMIAMLNGQIDVSGKYRKADDIGPGHATHHQFFTPDLQFIDKRLLTDVQHIDLTSLLGIGDVIHFVTSTDLWGDMIVLQYDPRWNYLGTKTIKEHASAPEGLAFDGMRFYVSYVDNSLSKPFEPGSHDNIRLAAFDADWNLLDDIAVTSISPDEHRAPGRPSLTLRDNRIYVCYDQADNALPDLTPEEADLQVYVKVYEVSQNP